MERLKKIIRSPGARNAGRAVGAAAFFLIFAVILTNVSGVLRGRRTSSFYMEERNSLDVIFFGSSHMLNDVTPMELWHDYGIVSHNAAEYGQVLPITYYVLLDALDRQDPELVVVDVYKIIQDTLIDGPSYLHRSIDTMPMGRGKLAAVYDLVPAGERTEYLWDIAYYHNRWKELRESDLALPDNDTRGWDNLPGVLGRTDFELISESETAEPPAVAVEYLHKIARLCKERGVDLLFVATPYETPVPDDMDRQRRVNAVAGLAREWGVPFLNLMYRLDEMDFDFATDLADINHANLSGARKITSYLGAYITENYDIPDRRGEARYAQWDEAYARYVQKLENT